MKRFPLLLLSLLLLFINKQLSVNFKSYCLVYRNIVFPTDRITGGMLSFQKFVTDMVEHKSICSCPVIF